uniref:Uncharacterized protein n=1 Tax=Rhizophora mucronata TaxID=61149 RepID=A0A2P2MZ73_RHIMU
MKRCSFYFYFLFVGSLDCQRMVKPEPCFQDGFVSVPLTDLFDL